MEPRTGSATGSHSRRRRRRRLGLVKRPSSTALPSGWGLSNTCPHPAVYLTPDPSPNAFATGRNPSHAAICVNEGLLRVLDEEELYGVLAHEFAHVRNRDILISSVVAVLAGTITMIANMAQWGLMFGGFGGRDDRDRGGAGGLVVGLLMIILAPLAAMLIQLAVS